MIRNSIFVGLLAGCLTWLSPMSAQDNRSPTADQQKNNVGDREMTQKIRKAVMADKSLSTSAHNVTIITQNGMVTLRGVVRSDAEKNAIGAKAVEIAGSASNVSNQLTVKTN